MKSKINFISEQKSYSLFVLSFNSASTLHPKVTFGSTEKGEVSGRCKICKNMYKAPGGSTSGLRKHLKLHTKQAKQLKEAEDELKSS
jgi:hypothetical protein